MAGNRLHLLEWHGASARGVNVMSLEDGFKNFVEWLTVERFADRPTPALQPVTVSVSGSNA